jgi:zinc and cadmium transporter
MSSLTNVAGGLVGYLALDAAQGLVPMTLILAASGFLYIAVADLLPRLREQSGVLIHCLLIGCGVLFVTLGTAHVH